MKKNILFIMTDLSAAGGQKSLVNLLSQIDYNLYNVDLFLLNPGGIFMGLLPNEVSILSLQDSYMLFSLPLLESIKKLLIKRKFSLIYNRIMFTLTNRFSKNTSKGEQYSWKHLSKSIDTLDKSYDAAIGFLEKTSTYFCIDKVKASQKIGWVHIDYNKLGMDPNFDIKYFKELNKIITVSEECAKVLKSRFPSQKNKVEVIYNVVSPRVIEKMAKQAPVKILSKKDDEITILSIGRLHYQKGFEIAIKSCKKLVDKGYNIKWNIIGEGEEREKLTKLIHLNHLENYFSLLGLKSNPYPYINQSDIYVQPSRFEGKSIAIDEAKILWKPIIVTNYSTAKDQIMDGINGLIAEMTPESVADKIEMIINNIELKNKIVMNLSKEKLGTEDEIFKLYNAI